MNKRTIHVCFPAMAGAFFYWDQTVHDLFESTTPERKPSLAKCVAMYVRMSTDHQKYSTENQADAIREYAARKQLQIIATYADEGKSGLSVDGRPALMRLIDDVQSA